MFGGSDVDDRIDINKQMLKQYNTLKNCEVIAISEDIQNRLKRSGFSTIQFDEIVQKKSNY